MAITAAKVKGALVRHGVSPFKVKKKHDGLFLVEFRRDDGGSLASPDTLSNDVVNTLGNVTVIAQHEWFRDWQPGCPRAVVLIEVRLNGTAAAVTARKAAQATA